MSMEQFNQGIGIEAFPSGKPLKREVIGLFAAWSKSIRDMRAVPQNVQFYQLHERNSHQAFEKSLGLVQTKENAIILGSGNLIDVPCSKLLTTFDSVDFSDIDVLSTRAVLNKLPNNESKNVGRLVQEDITGVYHDLMIEIDQILNENDQYEDALRGVIQKLSSVVKDDNIDMNPLADVLGRGSYDFVSSSFIVSQLSLGILKYINDTMKKKYANSPEQSKSNLSEGDREFLRIFTVFSKYLSARHFELLAKLLKPNGVLHLSITPSIVYFRRDANNQIIKVSGHDIFEMDHIINSLNLFFVPDDNTHSSWTYVKTDYLGPADLGEVFQAQSIPNTVKMKDGVKVDEWNEL